MSALALLLLLAGGVETPLGPYARPGVPVLLHAEERVEVDLDGWVQAVEGPTLVHAPRLPVDVRANGATVATLEPAPELLVGVVGAAPPDLAARLNEITGAPIATVAIRGDGIGAESWRALDVFDRVVVLRVLEPSDAGLSACLENWARAGGDLVRGPGETAVAPPAIPRPPADAPLLYDLVEAPLLRSAAFVSARWIVLGVAVAVAVQLLLGALGWMSRRVLLIGLFAVAALGSIVGGLRVAADYEPVWRGRIEVRYRRGDAVRIREITFHGRAGPGARVVPAAGALPVPYRAGGTPWWTRADRACAIDEGYVFAFLTERVETDPAPSPELSVPDPGLRRTFAPRSGDWETSGSPHVGRPSAEAGKTRLLARLRFVAQD